MSNFKKEKISKNKSLQVLLTGQNQQNQDFQILSFIIFNNLQIINLIDNYCSLVISNQSTISAILYLFFNYFLAFSYSYHTTIFYTAVYVLAFYFFIAPFISYYIIQSNIQSLIAICSHSHSHSTCYVVYMLNYSTVSLCLLVLVALLNSQFLRFHSKFSRQFITITSFIHCYFLTVAHSKHHFLNQQLNMLINKLIHKVIFPFRLSPAFSFGSKKAEKKKEKATERQPNSDQNKQQQKTVSAAFGLKTKSSSFYRRIVKTVNARKRSEHVIFTEHSLSQIIETATRKDLPLLFEAYYNYLGHYTNISNRTVDGLLEKSINLCQLEGVQTEQYLKKIFQVLQHHEYLSYYPHYDVTVKAAQLALKLNNFEIFLKILREKLLIKLNESSVRKIYSLVKDEKHIVTLTKILSYRTNRNLINNLTGQDLLGIVTPLSGKAAQVLKESQQRYLEKQKISQAEVQSGSSLGDEVQSIKA